MDRDSLLLLALGSLVVAAFTVGVSGWVLVLRERRAGAAPVSGGGHREGHEEE
jgi:hypothetical protein